MRWIWCLFALLVSAAPVRAQLIPLPPRPAPRASWLTSESSGSVGAESPGGGWRPSRSEVGERPTLRVWAPPAVPGPRTEPPPGGWRPAADVPTVVPPGWTGPQQRATSWSAGAPPRASWAPSSGGSGAGGTAGGGGDDPPSFGVGPAWTQARRVLSEEGLCPGGCQGARVGVGVAESARGGAWAAGAACRTCGSSAAEVNGPTADGNGYNGVVIQRGLHGAVMESYDRPLSNTQQRDASEAATGARLRAHLNAAQNERNGGRQ